MPNLKGNAQGAQRNSPEETSASPGNNSASVTPKDVSARDASSRDIVERKTASDDAEEREQALLDDAVEMTFPASDPIAVPSSGDARKRAQAHR